MLSSVLCRKNRLSKVILLAFGIFLSLAATEIILRCGGAAVLFYQRWNNDKHLQDSRSYRILTLGESTTQGSYPDMLEKVLNDRQKKIRFSVFNEGISGVSSAFILEQLRHNLDTYRPQLLVTMIGINDNPSTPTPEIGQPQGARSWFWSLRVHKLFKYLLNSYQARAADREVPAIDEKQALILSGKDIYDREDLLHQIVDPLLATGQGVLALHYLSRILEKYPNHVWAHFCKGHVYWTLGQLGDAERVLRETIPTKSLSPWTFVELSRVLRAQKKWKEAETLLLARWNLDPLNQAVVEHLAETYRVQGLVDQEENLWMASISRLKEPFRPWALLSLARCLKEHGKFQQARWAEIKATESGAWEYGAATQRNYRLIVESALARKIRVVAMQYPMRPVEPLVQMLSPVDPGIVYVDNRKPYLDALQHQKYDDLFSDRFAGDFGHCTPAGCRLLAENLADIILTHVINPIL